MSEIAVLIPCYNESITIKKVIEDYKKALPEATIYVYDNNSTDGTDEIARAAGAVVRYEYRQGKGKGVPHAATILLLSSPPLPLSSHQASPVQA